MPSTMRTAHLVRKFEARNPIKVIAAIVNANPMPGIGNLKRLSILVKTAYSTYTVSTTGTRKASPLKK